MYSQSAVKLDEAQNLEALMDAVAIIPFNSIPKLGDNVRTWSCYAKDDSCGRPHPLSLDFLKQWPYNEEFIRMLPETRKVNMAVAGPLASRINLTKMGINNLVKIAKPVVSLRPRSQLSSTPNALALLAWLKKAVRKA